MVLRFLTKTLMALSLLVFLTGFTAVNDSSAQTNIREIRINGAQRVEPATVLTYLGVRVGQEANSQNLNQALKNLYGTGLFADVAMKQDRGILFVDVIENPIINEIAFEGNGKIKDDELRAEISLRPRQVFTRTQVQNDVARVYEIYRRTGRFAANVDPKIIKLDQNRVNLVFEINEGNVTKIQGIRFVGNEAYDDDALRSELSTKEDRWYRFLTTDDRYDPDRIEYDKELLRRFYLKEGYADFQVVTANAELGKDQKDFYLTFNVDEGPRYRVGSVAIDSALRGHDSTPLRDEIKFVPGEWYDADAVEESVRQMTDSLGDNQYAFVDIRPNLRRNTAEDTIDVTFQIGESPRVFVERIEKLNR